jgi:hypothetical protein
MYGRNQSRTIPKKEQYKKKRREKELPGNSIFENNVIVHQVMNIRFLDLN